MVFNKEQSRESIKQQNNERIGPPNKSLAEFKFNHQECDMILMRGHRRQIRCHQNETTDLGNHSGLFKPFADAAKWFRNH